MVKNFIIGGLLCLVAALVIGVEPLQRLINETTSKGTLKGVETCLSYSSSQLLSTEAVRSTCVLAFQKQLYADDHATGRAGPRIDQRSVSWGGLLENKTHDHVTTWIQLSVGIFDAEGNEQTFSAETPIWIDPLAQTEFRVELPDVSAKQFDKLEFCESEDAAPKSCISWGITEIMGFRYKLSALDRTLSASGKLQGNHKLTDALLAERPLAHLILPTFGPNRTLARDHGRCGAARKTGPSLRV